MIIAVGTMNGAKNEAARTVLSTVWREAQFVPLDVPSGVAAMPMSAKETLQGARNRARAALELQPDAMYGIGLEGGVEEIYDTLFLGGWAVIVDRQGNKGEGASARVALPHTIAERLRAGEELGPLMQTLLKDDTNTVRHTLGTHGILTDERYTRVDEFTHALQCAVAPFVNAQLYK
jgi:inosine/xanthosine triphosphatase